MSTQARVLLQRPSPVPSGRHPVVNCNESIARIKDKNKKRLMILLITMGGALVIGTTGYKVLANMGLSEAFYNAAMILSGMGPIDDLRDKTGAKIFASFFALFSGAFCLIIFAFLVQSIFLSIIEMRRIEEECPPPSQ